MSTSSWHDRQRAALADLAELIRSRAERGYDLTAHTSEGLSALPQEEFAAAITMGCGDECPMVRAVLREDWGIPDPKEKSDEEFREIRDGIEAKVKNLLSLLGCLKEGA